MSEWWNNLDTLLKVLYCIAIPSSLILLLQTLVSLIGFGEHGAGHEFSDTSGLDLDCPDHSLDMHSDFCPGHDADISDLPDSGDGSNPADFSTLRLFTIQGFVAFFTVFSWTSIVFVSSGTYRPLGIIIGIILGFCTMAAIAKMMQYSRRLTENGTVDLKNSIGEIGTVYIPIPANAAGQGKIVIKVQDRLGEYSAITYANTPLPSNTSVRVTDLRSDVLVVEADV